MRSAKTGDTAVRTLPGEKHTPFGLARKLNAKVILESSSLSRGRERYSVLLVQEAFQIHQEPNGIIMLRGKERRVMADYSPPPPSPAPSEGSPGAASTGQAPNPAHPGLSSHPHQAPSAAASRVTPQNPAQTAPTSPHAPYTTGPGSPAPGAPPGAPGGRPALSPAGPAAPASGPRAPGSHPGPPPPPGSPRTPDILDTLQSIAARHAHTETEYPFPAGGIGFLSFEFAARCDAVHIPPRPDPLGLPLAAFIFGHVYVIFDHYTDQVHLIGINYGEDDIDLEKALDDTEARINDLNFNYMMEQTALYPAIVASTREESESYKAAVAKFRREIIKGNLLQGLPSRRLEIATEMPAIEAYRSLRSANPSPYQFYLDFGPYQLFGASPEVHVKVQNDRVLLRPLAGTRRRGANEAEDRALAAELLADPKELAEHLMLVDLGRNDLGRVCNVGSVEVTEMMNIEKYSKVMHIVSQVEGTLSPGKTAADVIRATFPAGTVSGAPKIQAVNTIAAMESVPRSFYAGLVGYLEPNGSLDTCITIRSALKKENRLFLQAGAGVVYDSNPERELEETNEKLRALALAAGVEV